MQSVTLTFDGPVATITLNQPARRNALAIAMWQAIPALVTEACASPTARLLVVTGAGGHFSAGADISELPGLYADPDRAAANQQIMLDAMSALEASTLPVLAAINGVCIGGGCGLALACDWRWASPEAVFAITPARLGLAYGIADTRRLVDAVGIARAKDILFTGRQIDARTALAWGLIDQIVEPDTMAEAIASRATELGRCARSSIAATRATLADIAAGARDDTDASRARFAAAFTGADFAEGFAAFMAKRAPRFP